MIICSLEFPEVFMREAVTREQRPWLAKGFRDFLYILQL